MALLLAASAGAMVPDGAGAVAPVGSKASTPEACIMTYEGEMTCYENADAFFTAMTGVRSRGLTTRDLGKPAVVEKLQAGLRANAGSFSRTQAAAGDYLNALFYDYTNFEGPILSMVSPWRCDADTGVEVQWGTLAASWQNRINSGRAYNNCEFKLWDNPNYSGATYGYDDSAWTFGAMNNATESVRMR